MFLLVGSLWGPFGIFGVFLDAFWLSFGVPLGSLWGPFGIPLGVFVELGGGPVLGRLSGSIQQTDRTGQDRTS